MNNDEPLSHRILDWIMLKVVPWWIIAVMAGFAGFVVFVIAKGLFYFLAGQE